MDNIMIIDDSPMDRKLIRQILEANLKRQVTFYEADSGRNIINKIKECNIGVCILDIMMPGKDGFQVLNEMKEDIILKDIPVIVYTSLNDEETIKKALDAGAHDYFRKPLSKEDMRVLLPLKIRNAIEFTKREKEILYLSYHDKLTGLYNRRYFEEEMARLVTCGEYPISIMVGDVNGLKLANDAFGHDAGDRLLVKIADILKEECYGDMMIARTGGDEFVIVMPNTDLLEARQILHRIKERCYIERDDPIKPSISLGCAVMERQGLKLSDLYKEAEDKMYKSKVLDAQSHRSSVISALIKVMQAHYPDTAKQNRRLERLALETAGIFHLSEEQLNNLLLLIYLHDIGISALPETILCKNENLTVEDEQLVKQHCEIGLRIISSISELSCISRDVLYHHELWGGQGYPYGLKGEQIPLIVRIYTLLEMYDNYANASENVKSKEDVADYLSQQSGQSLDPKLTENFSNYILGIQP